MSELPHLADVDALPHEPLRPDPPRTWRDRIDEWSAVGISPGRIAAAVVAVVVAGVVGWRLLAPPPAPPEMALPFADQALPEGGRPGEVAAAPGGGEAGTAAPASAGTGADGTATDADPEGEVVVHVAGAVVSPGVQRLPVGSRAVDAVEAAGGALPDADLARINLAAVVTDGEQLYVLRQGENPPPLLPSTSGGAGSESTGGSPALVDVNRATASELEELPGIGPTTAASIIDHREQHGPFASVDDLLDVRGIGEAKLEQIRGLVTV